MDRPEASPNRLDIAIAGHTGNANVAKRGLSSADPKIRASAILALHNLKQLSTDDLTLALNDQDSTVRRRACELAASYGGVPLSNTLRDSDPFVVETALWALGERGDGTELATICEIAKNHPESLVREAAVAALGAIGDQDGLETIIGGLKDRPNVRRRAVVALAAFEGDDVDMALRRATRDRDWQTRQIAEDLLEITEGSSD